MGGQKARKRKKKDKEKDRKQVIKLPTAKRMNDNFRLMVQAVSEHVSYVWWRGSVAFLMFIAWLQNNSEDYTIDDLPLNSDTRMQRIMSDLFMLDIRSTPIDPIVHAFRDSCSHDLPRQMIEPRLPEQSNRKLQEKLRKYPNLQPIKQAAHTHWANTKTMLIHTYFQKQSKVYKLWGKQIGLSDRAQHMFRLQANGWFPHKSDFDSINANSSDEWYFEEVLVPQEPETGRRLITKHFLANNLHATLKAHIELSNCIEQMRSFSNPNQTTCGFQIVPLARCKRKKVFLDCTTLTALAKKAGYDAKRDDKRGNLSRTDVHCVVEAALGKYKDSLQKEEKDEDKIKQRTFNGGMHTDGISMSLHFDIVEDAVDADGEQQELHKKCRQIENSGDQREIALDPGRKRLAAVNSADPDDDGIAFGKHEYHRKSGHNTYRKISAHRSNRSEEMQKAIQYLSKMHSNRATFDGIKAHVQAQRDTAKTRWFVATRTTEGKISYRLEHLHFRSYRQGRKQLDRFFEKVKKHYTVNGKSPVVFYGAGCANATGKCEKGGSPVDAQKRACMKCMRAMKTKTTDEYRSSKTCPFCTRAEVEVVPRTKSRRMRCTNLGCAAFKQTIDRDLDVATKNIVRAGRAKERNEEKPLDLQYPPNHERRVQWRKHCGIGLTFVCPRWKRSRDSCPYPGTSAGMVMSL